MREYFVYYKVMRYGKEHMGGFMTFSVPKGVSASDGIKHSLENLAKTLGVPQEEIVFVRVNRL